MTAKGWLGRIFSGGGEARRPLRYSAPLRARYDAAETTASNRKHWAGVSIGHPDEPTCKRRTIRARARHELDNNAYARGIARTLANDTVGTGPRLQMLGDDPALCARVEAEFTAWGSSIGLGAKLRDLCLARVVDGEVFALMTAGRPADAISLDVVLISADRVTGETLCSGLRAGDGVVDGIRYEAGRPTAYRILRAYPGASGGIGGDEHDWIDARHVLHYLSPTRVGQTRGVSELAPSLPLFAQLRRYTLAVIEAAETGASVHGVIYSDAPPEDDAAIVEPYDEVELQRNTFLTLPGGHKIEQLQPRQPAATYGEFKREILNEIARALNMPYNVAAGNSSSYNYASGRLDYQVYGRAIRVEQANLVERVLDPIFAAWRREASVAGALAVPTEHQWLWPGHEHVDPAKEALATERRLKTGTTTLAIEYARAGRDWEAMMRQIARERRLARELGIDLASAWTSPSATAAEAETTAAEAEADAPEVEVTE